MDRRRARGAVILSGIVAAFDLAFFGAFTSLSLAAPGVGPEAEWIPRALIAEAVTIIPLGFLLCVQGSDRALLIAGVIGVGSLLLSMVAASLIDYEGASFLQQFVWIAVPGLVLLAWVVGLHRMPTGAAGR